MRNCAKVGSDIVKKFVKDSGLVDEDTANIVEGVADGVKNQAEADRDASVTDRLKMAGQFYTLYCQLYSTVAPWIIYKPKGLISL